MNNFVDSILAADANAKVVVMGDINDFEFSETMDILEGGVMTALMKTLTRRSATATSSTATLSRSTTSSSATTCCRQWPASTRCTSTLSS